MTISDRRLHQLGRLAQLAMLSGVGLWLVSVVSMQLTKLALGGTTLLNWACGIGVLGLIGNMTVKTIKMKRLQRDT